MGYPIKLEAEFYIGQPVYIKTDPEQVMGIVVAYRVTEREVHYEVSRGIMVNVHAGCELSDQKNVGQYA